MCPKKVSLYKSWAFIHHDDKKWGCRKYFNVSSNERYAYSSQLSKKALQASHDDEEKEAAALCSSSMCTYYPSTLLGKLGAFDSLPRSEKTPTMLCWAVLKCVKFTQKVSFFKIAKSKKLPFKKCGLCYPTDVSCLFTYYEECQLFVYISSVTLRISAVFLHV